MRLITFCFSYFPDIFACFFVMFLMFFSNEFSLFYSDFFFGTYKSVRKRNAKKKLQMQQKIKIITTISKIIKTSWKHH